MPLVLGIDAAWTAGEPSGVALVEQKSGTAWRCLAVAPSYEAFIGFASGELINWDRPARGNLANVGALLQASENLAGRRPDLVAIDMPVSTVPFSSRRAADEAVSLEFGGRWCAAHSPNDDRPGRVGRELSQSFVEVGYMLATAGAVSDFPRLIEVYPHPALLSLLRRPRRVPYKVSKSTKYWPGASVPERIDSLLLEFGEISKALATCFGAMSMTLPSPMDVKSLSQLKRYEDSLDALVCAWVGAEHLNGRTVPLGDDTAAIWCPSDVVKGYRRHSESLA